MGVMVNNLHSMGKEIEFYANKLHCVDQRIEVSSFYILLLFSKMGSIQVTIPVMLIIFFLCWEHNKHRTYYAYNIFTFFENITTNILYMIPIFCLFPTISCLQRYLGTGTY